MKKIILDLCGGTGSWSKPYVKRNYDVRVITLPDFDVNTYKPPRTVYGVMAAPPCDHLAGSGSQYWEAKDADGRTDEAVKIVRSCLKIINETNPKFWCLENPIGRIPKLIPELGKPKMYFNPWEYGDPYCKKTCLWGNFNIPIKHPVNPIIIRDSKGHTYAPMIWKTGGKTERTKMLRSITPSGFAKSFFEANQ